MSSTLIAVDRADRRSAQPAIRSQTAFTNWHIRRFELAIATSGISAKRNAEAQHHLTEHERPRRVESDAEDDEGRDERDQPPDHQRYVHLEQATHDRGPRVGAHARRREP